MLGVADGRRGEDRWELQGRRGGLLTGKLLFIRRATAWPLPRNGKQSRSSHLGSGAVPGLPLLLCVGKWAGLRSAPAPTPLALTGAKKRKLHPWSFLAHTFIFQVELRKVKIKSTF